jgi:rhamnulose-1-phosphate aldolase
MQAPVSFSPELQATLADMAEVAGYLWDKGWAERNAGNISVDVSHLFGDQDGEVSGLPRRGLPRAYPALAGRGFLVTGTQKRMRDVCKEPAAGVCLIRMAKDAAAYSVIWPAGAAYWPSSELPAHLGIHQFLLQTQAPQTVVVHTHPNEMIALTHAPAYAQDEPALNRLLWAMHPETKVILPEGIGLVPYTLPGSQELADATVAALRGRRVVTWEKHGVVAIGTDVFEALDLIDTVNKSAQVYFLCKSAGFEPQGLNLDQIAALERPFGSR